MQLRLGPFSIILLPDRNQCRMYHLAVKSSSPDRRPKLTLATYGLFINTWCSLSHLPFPSQRYPDFIFLSPFFFPLSLTPHVKSITWYYHQPPPDIILYNPLDTTSYDDVIVGVQSRIMTSPTGPSIVISFPSLDISPRKFDEKIICGHSRKMYLRQEKLWCPKISFLPKLPYETLFNEDLFCRQKGSACDKL